MLLDSLTWQAIPTAVLEAQVKSLRDEVQRAAVDARQTMWAVQDRSLTDSVDRVLDGTLQQARQISDRIRASALLIALWSTLKEHQGLSIQVSGANVEATGGLPRYYRLNFQVSNRARSVYLVRDLTEAEASDLRSTRISAQSLRCVNYRVTPGVSRSVATTKSGQRLRVVEAEGWDVDAPKLQAALREALESLQVGQAAAGTARKTETTPRADAAAAYRPAAEPAGEVVKAPAYGDEAGTLLSEFDGFAFPTAIESPELRAEIEVEFRDTRADPSQFGVRALELLDKHDWPALVSHVESALTSVVESTLLVAFARLCEHLVGDADEPSRRSFSEQVDRFYTRAVAEASNAPNHVAHWFSMRWVAPLRGVDAMPPGDSGPVYLRRVVAASALGLELPPPDEFQRAVRGVPISAGYWAEVSTLWAAAYASRWGPLIPPDAKNLLDTFTVLELLGRARFTERISQDPKEALNLYAEASDRAFSDAVTSDARPLAQIAYARALRRNGDFQGADRLWSNLSRRLFSEDAVRKQLYVHYVLRDDDRASKLITEFAAFQRAR